MDINMSGIDFIFCCVSKSGWNRKARERSWVDTVSLLTGCVMAVFLGICLYLEYFYSVGMRVLAFCFPSSYVFFMEYGVILSTFWYIYVHKERRERILKEYHRKLGSSRIYRISPQVIALISIIGSFLIPISAGILLGYKNNWGNG